MFPQSSGGGGRARALEPHPSPASLAVGISACKMGIRLPLTVPGPVGHSRSLVGCLLNDRRLVVSTDHIPRLRGGRVLELILDSRHVGSPQAHLVTVCFDRSHRGSRGDGRAAQHTRAGCGRQEPWRPRGRLQGRGVRGGVPGGPGPRAACGPRGQPPGQAASLQKAAAALPASQEQEGISLLCLLLPLLCPRLHGGPGHTHAASVYRAFRRHGADPPALAQSSPWASLDLSSSTFNLGTAPTLLREVKLRCHYHGWQTEKSESWRLWALSALSKLSRGFKVGSQDGLTKEISGVFDQTGGTGRARAAQRLAWLCT